MAFEVSKGRVCDSLQNAQKEQISAITKELLHTGEKINLQNTVIDAQAAQILGWTNELTAKGDLWASEKQGLKTQVNRLRAWLVGLVGFDVAVVILVLLVL